MDWTSLENVLAFLIGGGAPVVAMYAASLLAENWKAWITFPKWVKFLSPMFLAILLAFGAQVLVGYADIIKTIAPWWTILAVTIASYIASQKAYMSVKSSGYGESGKR
jgi:hypothetical protein